MNNHPKKNTSNFSKVYFNLMILIGLMINIVFFPLPIKIHGYQMDIHIFMEQNFFNLINNQNFFFWNLMPTEMRGFYHYLHLLFS